jgi:hypothetical protein
MSIVFSVLGALLILFGFGYCVLWYWPHGLFIYLLGVLLLAFSKSKPITKVLWILIPLVIFYPVGWLVRVSYNATPETFLVPANFQGRFRIVYDENCGITPKVEHGRQILEIPADGILLVKPKPEAGWRDQAFYYVTPQGSRQLIAANYKKADENQPNAFMEAPAVVTYNLDTGDQRQLTYNYIDFQITWKDTIRYEPTTESARFDSLTRVKVIRCRADFQSR